MQFEFYYCLDLSIIWALPGAIRSIFYACTNEWNDLWSRIPREFFRRFILVTTVYSAICDLPRSALEIWIFQPLHWNLFIHKKLFSFGTKKVPSQISKEFRIFFAPLCISIHLLRVCRKRRFFFYLYSMCQLGWHTVDFYLLFCLELTFFPEIGRHLFLLFYCYVTSAQRFILQRSRTRLVKIW